MIYNKIAVGKYLRVAHTLVIHRTNERYQMDNKVLDNFTNVKRSSQTLPEQVSEQIRQLIIDRHLGVGEKLPNEFELAEQLHISRGCIREAIKLLVARNVLEVRRGRGTFIADHTGLVQDPFGFSYLEDEERLVRELFQIRVQLEPWIAGLAAEYATEEDLASLRQCHAEMTDLLQKGENGWAADQKFHIAVANCTQNRVLPMLIPVITYSVHLFMKHNHISLEDETLNTHEDIVKAIEAHNAQQAREAMWNHLALNLRTVPALKDVKI